MRERERYIYVYMYELYIYMYIYIYIYMYTPKVYIYMYRLAWSLYIPPPPPRLRTPRQVNYTTTHMRSHIHRQPPSNSPSECILLDGSRFLSGKCLSQESHRSSDALAHPLDAFLLSRQRSCCITYEPMEVFS